MADKLQALAGITTRQKIIGGVFALIVIFLIWQIKDMFGSGGASTPAPVTSSAAGGPAQPVIAPPPMPQQAALPKAVPTTQREAELLRLQQETEAKYIAALNELQMLKVEKEIAEINKEIASAKKDTITSQKDIVELLSPREAQPSDYAQSLAAGAAAAAQAAAQSVTQEASYTVVSVSQIRNKWSAVLGYSGNLYNVSVGDILSADGSKVVAIDKSGVTIEKNGTEKKVSLVPII